MQTNPGFLDVHHHLIPPAFVKATQDLGLTKFAGRPLPLPFTEAACTEAQFALDHLKTDGVVLLCSEAGTSPDSFFIRYEPRSTADTRAQLQPSWWNSVD